MQNQNVLALDVEKCDDKNSNSSTDHCFDAAPKKDSKYSKPVEKNQKIYSEIDSKNFENIIRRCTEKMSEKTITPHQLLTQNKEVLMQLFSLGATVEEILTFLKENNFTGITAESLKAFLKKKK